MGQIIDVNYDWQYKVSFEDEDLDILTGDVENVHLPHTPKIVSKKYKSEELVSYYEKRLEITKGEDEENIFICFEGIRGELTLYINGILAGERHGEYGHFEANITKFIKYNAFNKISLVVKGKTGGAIYAPAYLKRKASAYIENALITTHHVLEDEKEVEVDVAICGLIEGMNVQVTIMDSKGGIVANTISDPLRSLELQLKMKTNDVEIWDVEDPVLYELHIFLQYEAHIIDEMRIPFGFKDVAFKSDGFYLNGRKLKLCGVSRGDGLELSNYSPIPPLESSDACIIKNELGMNMVKVKGESISPSFLKKCDELGLLIFMELPKWNSKECLLDEEAVYGREFASFIKMNRNYTGLVLWGIGTIEGSSSYEKNRHKLLKMLAPTIAIGGQSDDETLIDVYTYEDYTYTEGGNALESPDKIAPNNEIPYLISSHTGPLLPTKSFDTEQRRAEFALRHMRVLDESYASDRMCGVIANSFIDYSETTYLGARNKTCYFGLLDCDRQPKSAAYAYSSQQDEHIVMEVGSNMQGEDGALAGGLYIFTNCDKVKFYKDEVCIGEFYPDKEEFPHLPHPPIYIDDYIGDNLVTVERYSHKDAAFIKNILMAMATHSGDLPLDIKGKMVLARLKNRIDKKTINYLYQKYILTSEDSQIRYVFQGYKDDEKVATIVKGGYTSARIIAEAERHELVQAETYDATRITIKAVDEYGNLMPYINEVIRIETTGSVEIIGHTYQSLVGGILAVYVRTKGEVGTGVVSIKSNELGEGQLIFQVTRA